MRFSRGLASFNHAIPPEHIHERTRTMSLYRPASATETGPPIPGLIGASPAMEAVYKLTRKVAKTNASVLLLGETGTGKEMIATAIHRLSNRNSGPFVRVNCGAPSESL